MAKKGYTVEQFINKLREAEILVNEGANSAVISKKSWLAIIHIIVDEKSTSV